MASENLKSYCSALDLAAYIANYHAIKKNRDISSIKLQKSLYFLFAFWGGFVRKGLGQKNTEVKEQLPIYLFDEDIEAWVYGPVVPEVYRKFAHSNITEEAISRIKANPEIRHFIDEMLNEIFEVSDFKLVDISHQDKCWKDKFCTEEIMHNNVIAKEEIISEYAAKN